MVDLGLSSRHHFQSSADSSHPSGPPALGTWWEFDEKVSLLSFRLLHVLLAIKDCTCHKLYNTPSRDLTSTLEVFHKKQVTWSNLPTLIILTRILWTQWLKTSLSTWHWNNEPGWWIRHSLVTGLRVTELVDMSWSLSNTTPATSQWPTHSRSEMHNITPRSHSCSRSTVQATHQRAAHAAGKIVTG